MSEEFDESDIIFSDSFFSTRRRDDMNEKENRPVGFRENSKNKPRRSKTMPLPSPAAFSTSLPVNIPKNAMLRNTGDQEYSDDDGGRNMIPPHLIVGRRMEGCQMAFSVCTGNGRTLKGRDLTRVRNSVLRLTGFLEA